jgi:riboflavin synthase
VPVGGRFGGHFVLGHVDGVGAVVSSRRIGEALALDIRAAAGLEKYLVEKGSIALDGVSLTVNQVKGDLVSLMIIPFTLKLTLLLRLQPGQPVNLEADILTKTVVETVERMQGTAGERPAPQPRGAVTAELLEKAGFVDYDGK